MITITGKMLRVFIPGVIFTILASFIMLNVFEPNKAGDILLAIATVSLWIFTILYMFRSKWWVLATGRALAMRNLSISLILTQNTISSWTNQNYMFRSEIRAILYTTLIYGSVAFMFSLLQVQKEEHDELREKGSDHDATT